MAAIAFFMIIALAMMLYKLTIPIAGLVYFFVGERAGNYTAVGGLTLTLIASGLALYVLRSRLRSLYGLLEIIAAIAFMAVSVGQYLHTQDLTAPINPYLPIPNTFLGALQVIASVYIFVRGMDNVGEGLKAYPALEARWRSVFQRPEDIERSLFLRVRDAIQWLRRRA